MARIINLFCGYDKREAIGFHVFAHSVIERASEPVAIVPLSSLNMPQGSNAFTMSRFLIPYLMGFKGHAIFADASDMLAMRDVAELDRLYDPAYAVQVVKHPAYTSKHKTKYRGTDMECPNLPYARKNWASVMLVNCEHEAWVGMTPGRVEMMDRLKLLQFEDIQPVGDISDEWNRLVDEGQPVEGAAVMHWTAGIPAMEAYKDSPGADEWRKVRRDMEFI